METVADLGPVILDRIATLEVERAKIEAQVAVEMLDFQDVRRVQAERHDDPRLRDLEVSFAADEIGVAMHLPTRTVQCRLAESRRVRGLLPNTWAAHLAGRIDSYRVSLIASTVAKLKDNYQRIDLDHDIADYAAAHTPAQLRGKLKRFVAHHVTDDSAVKSEKAKRAVWSDHQDDGMTLLHAYIATADALRIDAMLTARARASSDERTFDQRRADEFVAQLLGQVDGQSISSRAVIGILVPVTTLTGVSDDPGTAFDGSFCLPADMVRDLAAEPGTLFHRVMTDPLGRILDITELGRFPTNKLKTAIDIRDGTCRFPTCSRPSMESDKDHEIPHPRGPTSGDNLRALCRRHHRIKTARIAEPTDYVMRSRDSLSHMEIELAHFIAHARYAA